MVPFLKLGACGICTPKVMNRVRIFHGGWPLVLCLLCAASLAAQEKCPAPPAIESSTANNIFTSQQEVDLGDIEAERVELSARVIHDDQLAAYLNRIVDHLLAQLPPTHLQFRVTLIDLPAVNAFSLPGGRIYVTRKMVAFARNDDDLADLLAHEMGHVLSHQGAIDATRQLSELLGVSSVGDRKDISEKFNRLLDNAARNPSEIDRVRAEEEPHQYQADQVALYVLANAGYSPASFADFFDRLAQTHGKSGDWLTNLLGMTTPNEKRLHEVRKNLESLPAACREQASATAPSQDFLEWQAGVIAYSGLGRKEVLPGLLEKKTLDPPLRSVVTNLKFSPDGKYILAQDDASIFVLSRDPLRLLFRADAPDSRPAQFTPDSRSFVFNTRGLRVEQWNVASGERASVHELTVQGGCLETLLSRDGQTLACVNDVFDLNLYDVAGGSAIFTKKAYFAPRWDFVVPFSFLLSFQTRLEDPSELLWVDMGFSPDSKVFIGASPSASIAVDVTAHDEISLQGALSDMVKGGFAFLDSGRVIATNIHDAHNSAILAFPSGTVLKRLPLGGIRLSAAAQGDYLIVRPFKDLPVAVLDLSSNKIIFGGKDAHGVDAYGETMVAQGRSGEIVLLDETKSQILAHTPLSLSPLGHLRVGEVSSDLKWLAISGDTAGAVWNIQTAQRLFFTRSFHGAYFEGDSAVLADYPKLDTAERSIGRLDLASRNISTIQTIDNDSSETVRQWGQFLVTTRSADKRGGSNRNMILEVKDVRGSNVLWNRTFPKEMPKMTLLGSSNALLLGWPADVEAAKDELKSDSMLRSRLNAIRDHSDGWLLEELRADTGAETGALVVDTGKGSFRIENAYAAGDWVVVSDSDSRVRVYSLSTKDEKATFFGSNSVISPAAGMMAIETEPGTIDFYGLASFEKKGELMLSSPVAVWRFSEDGNRFFVLAKDQNAYSFDLSRVAVPSGTASNATSSVQAPVSPANTFAK